MAAGKRAAAAIAALALAIGCGPVEQDRRRAPPEPALRIWAPIVVRWEPGHRRHVDFAIENPTVHVVALAAPDPANARVEVFGPESVHLCGVTPTGRATPGPRVALEPGEQVAVSVDLDAACAALPAGQYRYEVSYRAAEPAGPAPHPGAHDEARAFAGTIPAHYGQVFVSADPQVSEAPTPARQGKSAKSERGRGRSERPPAGDEPAAQGTR